MMRCKKHITDLSSAVGVCASCLRERLFVIMAAQAQEEDLKGNDFENNNSTPQLMFPRSVSPYISHRKSENFSGDSWPHQLQQQEIQFQRFFSTPHIGPSGKIIPEVSQKKKNKLGFSLFGNLFGFKSKKFDSDVPGRDSGTDSRSWLETMSLGQRRKKTKNSSIKGERTTISRKAEKGMSPPARKSSDEEEDNWMNNRFSGSLSECSKQWKEKETPKRTPSWIPPGKKGGHGHGQNGPGFGFCLSPLIKASPSRNWNKRGFPPE